MLSDDELTIDLINKLFIYDCETGDVKRLITTASRAKKGNVVGHVNNQGYLRVGIGKKEYQLHRIAYALHYGSFPCGDIDHINGIRTDNRIINLRVVDNTENHRNEGLRKTNKSGEIGISIHKATGKIIVQVRGLSKKRYVGLYDNMKDAIAARDIAYKNAGFHPEHGNKIAIGRRVAMQKSVEEQQQ